MDDLIKTIFGNYALPQLFGFFWFFFVGIIIYGLNETTNRDIKSSNTPQIWCWKFWFRDNWRRYLTTLLSTYVLFRFYVEFVGHELSNFEALLMGLVGDGVGATMKKRFNIMAADRKKIMINYKHVSKIDNKNINDGENTNNEI